MPITSISVAEITNFADGHEFGEAGAYVRLRGVAHGVLDPNAPENACIVDLDKAPRNHQGLVEYATDFDILRAQGYAARQRHPRLRRTQSRFEAHLQPARRCAGERSGPHQRSENQGG